MKTDELVLVNRKTCGLPHAAASLSPPQGACLKRDGLIVCLLLANVCLLVYASVLLRQKPIHDVERADSAHLVPA